MEKTDGNQASQDDTLTQQLAAVQLSDKYEIDKTKEVQKKSEEEQPENDKSDNVESGNDESNDKDQPQGKCEEINKDETKWNSLEHKGPAFAPPYKPLPENVRLLYGKQKEKIKLSAEAEEVACAYARQLLRGKKKKERNEKIHIDDTFKNNFFTDWQKIMTEFPSPSPHTAIEALENCNFCEIMKNIDENLEKEAEETTKWRRDVKEKFGYGYCTLNGQKQKLSNCIVGPPEIFIGRGEHPNRGKWMKRVLPENVVINCSKGKEPEAPLGHNWKKVINNNTIAYLAAWKNNLGTRVATVLHSSAEIYGVNSLNKYEMARELHKNIDTIRKKYRRDWEAEEMRDRQRAVALYFIDLLALRAGHEKDDDQADTVGCCSLRVKHITLHKEKDGKEYVVVFDFPGKDSIGYYNEMPVEKLVYNNLKLFKKNTDGSKKEPNSLLFDGINDTDVNRYLKTIMPDLTIRVFRTYNASLTMQKRLHEITEEIKKKERKFTEQELIKKITNVYKTAKEEVDVLLNHSVNAEISVTHYVDPRITVAWCKKYGVDIKKYFPFLCEKASTGRLQWLDLTLGLLR